MFEALLGSKFCKKCKYCVKCINSRVQLIRKKRQATVRFLKKDVADLLANGHELNAFGRIEALIVEINHMSCYDMIEQYCQCLLNQLPFIQKQRECPEEAMEAVSTLIFAAARFSDLPELYNLRQVFTKRYGSHMESSVNAEFVEKVQKKSFSTDKKLRLMHDIAEEFYVRWDSRAFGQKLSNPSGPLSDQPKRSISNIEGHSHAEMNGWNASVNQRKESIFAAAVEINGRNLNAAGTANGSNGAVFNGRKEAVINPSPCANGRVGTGLSAGGLVNGRKEAVINPSPSANGRVGTGLSAGGLVNGRKEAVINSVAAVNSRVGAVLNVGGSFNGRKEVVLNSDITVNGTKETVANSAMPFNRRNDAVSRAGEDREVASKGRWEPPSRTFVQKQLVQPEPRDIHVIPVVRNDRSNDPAEKIKNVPAAAKETENVEPVFDNAGACPYFKLKERQNGIQKDCWFKPNVIQNGIHKHDGLNDGTARSRSPTAQEGPGPIGLVKQSVAPAISRDVKTVNMIPPSTKLKESRNDSVERLAVCNESLRAAEVSDSIVQEKRPTVPVNSKDARPFNMIPPPYTKPKFRNPATPADDTELTDALIKNSSIIDHERSDDNERAKPVSVRRRLPKPTLVPEIDNGTNDAKLNGRRVDYDLYAEKNVDRNQGKTAADEMNGAVNDERHAHGRKKHGGRSSTATYDGDCDEEEATVDRLLVHFSKKGMNNNPSRRRVKLRAPPAELVADAGHVWDCHDDRPRHQGNGRIIHLSTTESVCYRPERVASLPSEPVNPVVEAGVRKGPARATSMQPDLLNPGGAHLYPRLPDYGESSARLIALKNA